MWLVDRCAQCASGTLEIRWVHLRPTSQALRCDHCTQWPSRYIVQPYRWARRKALQKTSRQDHQLSGPWFSRQMGHRWSCWRRVRGKPKSASDQKNLVLSVEHDRAALVPPDLVIKSSNQQFIKSTMNSLWYQNVHVENTRPSVQKSQLKTWTFQHDNYPQHNVCKRRNVQS